MRKATLPAYKHLSQEEIISPQQVFAELFDFMRLEDLQGTLWIHLKATATDTYRFLTRTEKELLFEVYVRLQKAIEAAHILLRNSESSARQTQ